MVHGMCRGEYHPAYGLPAIEHAHHPGVSTTVSTALITRNARSRIASLLALLLGTLLAAVAAADEAALWKSLQTPGHFALMRHAHAPGTGDPPNFRLGDCGTQRNLDDQGKAQARSIGERFRLHAIKQARIYSSQWCRCMETARALALGPVEELPVLNSFFSRADKRDEQDRALRRWLAARADSGVTVLVTHQVNITALSGVYPASGEIVVIRRTADGKIEALGSIRTQ